MRNILLIIFAFCFLGTFAAPVNTERGIINPNVTLVKVDALIKALGHARRAEDDTGAASEEEEKPRWRHRPNRPAKGVPGPEGKWGNYWGWKI